MRALVSAAGVVAGCVVGAGAVAALRMPSPDHMRIPAVVCKSYDDDTLHCAMRSPGGKLRTFDIPLQDEDAIAFPGDEDEDSKPSTTAAPHLRHDGSV